MTAPSAARALTREEFADAVREYGEAKYFSRSQQRVIASHAAVMAVFDALTARAEAAESAIAAVKALTDMPSAVRAFNAMRAGDDVTEAVAAYQRQRAEAVIGTAGLWPETPSAEDANG